jgi:zinc protease
MRSARLTSALTALALLLAAASPGLAQTAAAAPAKPKAAGPAPGPAPDVKFPGFEQKTLANGLRVVVIEQHEQPSVSLRLQLKAGKVFEPEGKTGLAGATAALLTKGTPTRSAQQIAQQIDFVGGALGAASSIESGFANALVTSDQLDLGLDLLSDIVLRPSFPEDEVERWRRQTLSGLQVSLQDPSYLADTALVRAIFGDHPSGRPADGTPESVQGLTRDDMVAFHKRQYIPNNAILAVVGDVKPAEAFAQVEKYFGSWAKGQEVTLPPPPKPTAGKNRIIVIDKPDAVQTEIRVGQVGLAYRDPDHFAAEVYNSVLGGNASARLYEEIRRKRGLSYGAGSNFPQGTLPGWFEAHTFTKSETTVEALEVLLDVLRGLEKDPVPDAELNAAKTYITGAFPLQIETPDGIADQVLEAMKYGLGRDYLETYNEKISAVTAANVQKFAASRIDPDSLVIVLAGNASAFNEPLKQKFGEFTAIPIAEVDLLRPDLRKVKAAAAPVSSGDQAKAQDILRQAQQAMGGKAFLEQRSQISKGSGTMTPPGMPQPMPLSSIVTYRVLPDKERTEITLPMGTMIQAFDGTNGWAGMGAQVQDATAQMKDEQYYGLDVLRRVGQPGWTARPLPDAEVNGKPAQVVELSDDKGHTTRFFVDPQTHLVVKIAFEAAGQASEALYSDYRPVNGIQVAHQVNLSQNGQPLIEIKLSEVQINPEVDLGLFKKPGG